MDGLGLSDQNAIETVLLTAREGQVRDLHGDIIKGACYPVGNTVLAKRISKQLLEK